MKCPTFHSICFFFFLFCWISAASVYLNSLLLVGIYSANTPLTLFMLQNDVEQCLSMRFRMHLYRKADCEVYCISSAEVRNACAPQWSWFPISRHTTSAGFSNRWMNNVNEMKQCNYEMFSPLYSHFTFETPRTSGAVYTWTVFEYHTLSCNLTAR